MSARPSTASASRRRSQVTRRGALRARERERDFERPGRRQRGAVADREAITVLNNELFVRGTDIQAIFDQLHIDEPTHAFYIGKELARASLAVTLGKTYRQEGALSWGYLTPPDDVKAEHVRLTQRSRPRRTASGQDNQ